MSRKRRQFNLVTATGSFNIVSFSDVVTECPAAYSWMKAKDLRKLKPWIKENNVQVIETTPIRK